MYDDLQIDEQLVKETSCYMNSSKLTNGAQTSSRGARGSTNSDHEPVRNQTAHCASALLSSVVLGSGTLCVKPNDGGHRTALEKVGAFSCPHIDI
jgi:hypothetical protein